MKIIVKIFFSVLFIFPFFGFTQNTLPTKININNDNPLKTELDLAVDKHVKSYFKDTKAVGVSIGITLKGKDYYYNYDTLPGVKYTYSNMGVSLLGTILESVYQDNYFPLVNKHILKPLQMESTTIDLSKADQKNIAKSHNEKGEVVPFWDIPALPAMGALRSNTSDMVKYIKANNTEKLTGIALSHQFTFEGEDGSLGLNWFFHTTKDGYRMYEHAGGTGGSRSSLEFFSELNSGFVILANSLANRKGLEKDISELMVKLSKKK